MWQPDDRTKGPWGGRVAMQGQGGFQTTPEATVAPTPSADMGVLRTSTSGPQTAQAVPSAGMGVRYSTSGPQTQQANPYGPIAIRQENQPNRWMARRQAGLSMLRRGNMR